MLHLIEMNASPAKSPASCSTSFQWFLQFLETGQMADPDKPPDWSEVPLYYLLEFIQNFPSQVAALKKMLLAQQLKTTLYFAPLAPVGVSFESQVQNQLWTPKAFDLIYQLSRGSLQAAHFYTPTQTPDAPLLPPNGAFSARVHLKQLNAIGQQFFERYLHPLNALLKIAGKSAPTALLEWAQVELFKNQASPVLTGCCTDTAALQGEAKFQEIIRNARFLQQFFIKKISSDTETNCKKIWLFNPSPYSRRGPVQFSLTEPLGGDYKNLLIQQADGRPVIYQVVPPTAGAENSTDAGVPKVNLLIDNLNVPALGFNWISVQNGQAPAIPVSNLKTGANFLENNLVRVSVQSNGAITIFDKQTQQSYTRLNVFEDSGDVGTTAQFLAPEKNKVYFSKNVTPRISLVECGPLRGAIRIRYRLKILRPATRGRHPRNDESGILRIWTKVHLGADSPLVFFETRVVNTLPDHRLRVRFETGTQTHFTRTGAGHQPQIQNHHGLTAGFRNGEEPDAEIPLQNWVTVTDEVENRGLTLLTAGLLGYQLLPDSNRTLTLTLLRSVGAWQTPAPSTALPENQAAPAAQCQRDYHFYYALLPHPRTEIERCENLARAFEQFWAPILAVENPTEINADLLQDQIRVQPEALLLSRFKIAEDGTGYILRLINPTLQPLAAEIYCRFPLAAIYLTPVNEQLMEALPLPDPHTFQTEVPATSVLSLKLIPRSL